MLKPGVGIYVRQLLRVAYSRQREPELRSKSSFGCSQLIGMRSRDRRAVASTEANSRVISMEPHAGAESQDRNVGLIWNSK